MLAAIPRILFATPWGGRGRIKEIVATVAVATVIVGGAALAPNIPGVVAPPSGTDITCNQSSTSASDFTADLAAISNGQTLCLTNAVDYGTFTGTTKNITIVAQAGSGPPVAVDATLRLNLGSGDNGTVTIDGGMDAWNSPKSLNIPTADINAGAANLTIKDFEVNGAGGSGRRWVMDPAPLNSNILIDHFYAHDVLGGEAFLYIDDSASNGDTGVTIQRGLFRNFSNDGVKLTGDDTVRVLNNKFMDFHESNSGDGNHTDEVQMLEGNHVIIGNWFTDGDQCLFSDDGTTNNTVTHNLVDNCGQWFMMISSDNSPSSNIQYNTITARTQDSDPGFQCGTNYAGFTSRPTLLNNIFQQIVLTDAGPTCVPVANHHNMLKAGQTTTGVGGVNFTGTQTYAGGSNLSTFDEFSDFCLAPSSTGYTGATDGGQVGICGGDWNGSNYGPPSGEGF